MLQISSNMWHILNLKFTYIQTLYTTQSITHSSFAIFYEQITQEPRIHMITHRTL